MAGISAAVFGALLWLSMGAAASAAAVPNYETTAITQADLQLYLSVMHGAADRLTHAKGDDAAALALMRKTHGNLGSPPGNDPRAALAWYKTHQHDTELLTRALSLSNIDDDIAKQRGVGARYDGIKGAVEDLMLWGGPNGGASCGGNCGGPAPTAAQIDEDKRMHAARNADWALIKPHQGEIAGLIKQVRHLGGAM